MDVCLNGETRAAPAESEFGGFAYQDVREASARLSRWLELTGQVTDIRDQLIRNTIGEGYVGPTGNLLYIQEKGDPNALVKINRAAYDNAKTQRQELEGLIR